MMDGTGTIILKYNCGIVELQIMLVRFRLKCRSSEWKVYTVSRTFGDELCPITIIGVSLRTIGTLRSNDATAIRTSLKK